MNAALQPYQTPFSTKALHARLSKQIDQRKLFAAIDADPDLVGAGVVYIDTNNTLVTLREFSPICSVRPLKLVLREPRRPMSTAGFATELKINPNESSIVMEAISTGLACGAAVLGWMVVLSSAGAVPMTGGGSSVLTFVSYSAAAASTAQCFNSGARTYMAAQTPARLEWLDSQEWYVVATSALDVLSLGGAVASGLIVTRAVKLLIAQGIPVRKALQGLTRVQRKRLTQEIIRANRPGISGRMLKLAQRNGEFPARYSNRQITQVLSIQLKDAVGATLTFAGSATAGVVGKVAVGIYEEIE